MKTGTLFLEIYGELLFRDSVLDFIKSMEPLFMSISDSYSYEHSRFGYLAAVILITIPLKVFWKNDALYRRLILKLNHYFVNWNIRINLDLLERSS